ncbi:MAG: SpoIIIAH-like family protein [Bacillota bacterium]|nr:SpoIIIAH-like family protein [Bacillota bacterium]
MKVFKRKQVVFVALVTMIALAGYFNWSYKNADNGSVSDSSEMALGEARLVNSNKIEEPQNTQDTQDYFANSRVERETGRSKSKESLNAIVNNKNSSEAAKQEAENRLIDMASRIEQEASAEGEIKARGFKDCVVFINDSSVSVIVKSDSELTGTDAAKIQEIIVRLTGRNPEEVKIVRYK